MTMSRIYNQYIDTSGNQCTNTLICALAYAHRGADTKATLVVLTGIGVLLGFINIGYRNQAF